MKIRAGEMRDQITIVKRVSTVEPTFGGVASSKVDLATVWAKSDFASAGASREVQKDGQVDALTRADFYVRFRTDLAANMWVRYRGRTFKILYMQEGEYRHFLKLACEAHDDSPT